MGKAHRSTIRLALVGAALLAGCTEVPSTTLDASPPQVDAQVPSDSWEDGELGDNVRFIESHPGVGPITVEPDRLRIAYAGPPEELGLHRGDIVVGESATGYLRRVVDILVVDDDVLLLTQQATLAETVKRASFHWNLAVPQRRVTGDPSESPRCFPNEPLLDATISGVPVLVVMTEGCVDFRASFKVVGDIDEFSLEHFKAQLTAALSVSLDVSAKIGGPVDYRPDEEIDLNGPLPLGTYPFVFYLGPLPIVGVVELDIFARLEIAGAAEGTVSAGFHTEVNVTAGAIYDAEAGWSPIWIPLHDPAPDPVSWMANGNLELEVHLRPEVRTHFYGVAGPYADLEPFLRGHFQVAPTPGEYDLGAGLYAHIGLPLDAFAPGLDRHYTFPATGKPLYTELETGPLPAPP